MQSVKLTREHRDTIRRRLLEAKFAAAEKAVAERRERLAEKVYLRAFSKADRDLMESLPEGWLPTVKTIRARLGGSDFGAKLADDRAVRVPSHKKDYADMSTFLLALAADDPLAKEYEKIEAEATAARRERDKTGREIYAVLFSVTTSNKLIEAWPEIRPVVESVCHTASTVNLPAPRVEYLNKLLCLKPEKPKAKGKPAAAAA